MIKIEYYLGKNTQVNTTGKSEMKPRKCSQFNFDKSRGNSIEEAMVFSQMLPDYGTRIGK